MLKESRDAEIGHTLIRIYGGKSPYFLFERAEAKRIAAEISISNRETEE